MLGCLGVSTLRNITIRQSCVTGYADVRELAQRHRGLRPDTGLTLKTDIHPAGSSEEPIYRALAGAGPPPNAQDHAAAATVRDSDAPLAVADARKVACVPEGYLGNVG